MYEHIRRADDAQARGPDALRVIVVLEHADAELLVEWADRVRKSRAAARRRTSPASSMSADLVRRADARARARTLHLGPSSVSDLYLRLVADKVGDGADHADAAGRQVASRRLSQPGGTTVSLFSSTRYCARAERYALIVGAARSRRSRS